jgi:predicted Zn-ribbon and HTH transcriptional regulator
MIPEPVLAPMGSNPMQCPDCGWTGDASGLAEGGRCPACRTVLDREGV